MRIAWFTHRYHPCVGGAENYGRAMVRRFVAAGDTADVVTSNAHDLWYFTDPKRRRVDAPRESRVDGARVLRYEVRHRPWQRYLGRILSYAPHWPTQCRSASYMPILPGIEGVRGDYDAVFAVGFPYTVFSYAALQTARRAGAALILTPFLHLATPGDAVNRHYTRPHQVRLLAIADLVVVQTELEARAVRDWGIPRARILTLGMAVEHAEVTGGDRAALRRRLAIPDGRAVVGHLATLDPNKGTNDLVVAVAQLNQSRPDDPVHLILAGPSSPDFERFLASDPAGPPPWLTTLGPLPPERRAEFYAALDVFAMPSRTDSFGIVFLEAWANGLPVVAADAGGVPEVVRHESTGLLVPFGDRDRLAAALSRLLDDPAAARRLGAEGRRLVSRGYTWDDRFATLRERTREVVDQPRLAPPRPAGSRSEPAEPVATGDRLPASVATQSVRASGAGSGRDASHGLRVRVYVRSSRSIFTIGMSAAGFGSYRFLQCRQAAGGHAGDLTKSSIVVDSLPPQSQREGQQTSPGRSSRPRGD